MLEDLSTAPSRAVGNTTSNILEVVALINPSKLVTKIKYHLLSHLWEDVICFDPMVGVAMETFECFNVIFYHCSILSTI
jgi:hypothetical protein